MTGQELSPAFMKLFGKRRANDMKPGLERVLAAANILGGSFLNIPSVLIAGTNGKGTTSGFLFRFIASLDIKTSIFTSPHLTSFEERIQLSHCDVTEPMLIAALSELEKALPLNIYDDLSFFEVTALLAFSFFEKLGAEFNVLEVGMGGRLDATNISEPMASIITNVGLDHEQYLGHSLSAIAGEKAGILRVGRPCFFGENSGKEQNQEVLNTIKEICTLHTSPLWRINYEFGLIDDEKKPGSFYVRLPGIPPFKGAFPSELIDRPLFLRQNFCLAFAVFYWLLHQDQEPFSKKHTGTASIEAVAQKALTSFFTDRVPWPPSLVGRFQELRVRSVDRTVEEFLLVDVCHNVDGVRVLGESLQKSPWMKGGKFPGIISILNDKNINGMLDILRSILEPLVLFKIDNERSLRSDDLEPRHRDLFLFSSFSEAWLNALATWRGQPEPWVICGSFRAIGEVLNYFKAFSHEETKRKLRSPKKVFPALYGTF